jgi:ABC-type multidrug transport system permease subunit
MLSRFTLPDVCVLLSAHPVSLQALLFVPVIYSMIGFQAQAEKCFFYFMMFLASISFYTIFGQFMVYVTPSQQIAQVRLCTAETTSMLMTTC